MPADAPAKKGANKGSFTKGDPRIRSGKKGRSGRKPDAFKALCAALVSDASTLKAARAILDDQKHPAWSSVFRAIAPYGYGEPTQKHEISGAIDLTVAAASARAKLAKLSAAHADR
jgi:hypothetical protein